MAGLAKARDMPIATQDLRDGGLIHGPRFARQNNQPQPMRTIHAKQAQPLLAAPNVKGCTLARELDQLFKDRHHMMLKVERALVDGSQPKGLGAEPIRSVRLTREQPKLLQRDGQAHDGALNEARSCGEFRQFQRSVPAPESRQDGEGAINRCNPRNGGASLFFPRCHKLSTHFTGADRTSAAGQHIMHYTLFRTGSGGSGRVFFL